jgi:hypothetical protein
MDRFDLRTSPSRRLNKAPLPGYGVGCVRIGELDETILFSTEIWSPSEYAQHWKAAAQLLMQGETGLFCTDLTKDNASIFVSFPVGTGFEFEEWLVPRRDLELDGLQIKIARHDRSEEASRWHVSADAVRAFAST